MSSIAERFIDMSMLVVPRITILQGTDEINDKNKEMIKALFKFDEGIPQDVVVIDTTLHSGQFKELSPFILPAPPAKNMENLWQFSKVYSCHVDERGCVNATWELWRGKGWSDIKAHRYPMGKGAIPLFSYWNGERLNYIQARKKIYIPEYAKNVIHTDSFKRLSKLYQQKNIILLDYDAYDNEALGMTLVDVVNNPHRKMGHAFVLMMILTGWLKRCLA